MQLITTHTGCDFDALASMVAVKKLYPEAKLCFSGSPSREVRDFMHVYGWLIPIEKISEKDLKKVKKLILVDTRWKDRIGMFGRLVGKKQVKIHIYDHHPSHPEDIKADRGVCKDVGATVSILIDLIKKRKIPISSFEATLFGLGIYEDTGSLSFFSTTSFDLRAVAYLLDKGAKLEFISNFLNSGLTEKQDALLRDFLNKARVLSINGVEVVVITTQIEEFVGGLSLPLHKFIDFKNPDVVFAIVCSGDKIFILARSRLPFVNVDDILSEFGGGGHNLAASVRLKDTQIKKVEEKLVHILQENIHSPLTIENIMHLPARFVFPEMQAGEVKEILDKEGLEVIPVQEQGKITGIISRQKVEHIVSYNSASSPIKSYYSRKFVAVHPSLSLKKAQRIIIEEEVPWLLVFQGESFLGVVTSFDIFKAFDGNFSQDSLKSLLEKKVPPYIMRTLIEAGKLANRMGFSVFIVGGFVRDLLLGNENLDIDLVVEGEGIVFARELARNLRAELTVHPKFGTATINVSEDFKLDVVTSRHEFYSHPGALPVVEKAALKEDLFRRDFTVNAMAISINPSDFGKLLDFFGGKKDLENKRVRVLHPKSFIDDPTRIFRAIRFEQRYRFSIDNKTERLIKEALQEHVFRQVSGKRIKEEILQILEEDRPGNMIRRMKALGVLEFIHPGIRLTASKDKIMDELVDAIARYEVLKGERSRRWLVRLALLLDKMEKEKVKNFCQRYSFTREEKEVLFVSIAGSRQIITKLKAVRMRPSSIYYLLESYPPEALILTVARTKSKLVKRRIISYLSSLCKVKLEISGEDLKKLNYKPSPEFSRILEEVKKAKLNGVVKTKEEEIEFIRKKFLSRR
ncbi:CBS domain-containing protein [Candidatus Aerophobetes bacterium]|nr:CBS domain-containing protein [Candidatus Aerophobetes bacterium]